MLLGIATALVGSLGAPLLPTVMRVEHVSLSESQWTLTISLLAGSVAAPILGRLGQAAHRRRRVVLVALGIVVAGCLVSALATAYPILLVGRVLQGVGLGLVPLALAIAREALRPQRARSVATLLGVTAIAGIGVGYPVIGLVVQLLGLSAAFWLGAIITALTLAIAAGTLPGSPSEHAVALRLDVIGAALLAVAVTAILLAASLGRDWGWGSLPTLGLLVVAVVSIAIWIPYELRTPEPLVRLRVLRVRSVLSADLSVLLVGIGTYPLLSLVVRFAQTTAAGGGFGWDAAAAGLLLLPYSAASFTASRGTARLAERWSAERLIAFGGAAMVVGLALFALTRENVVALVVAMALSGFGTGVVFAINPLQIQAGTPRSETASANSFYQVLRYIGYSVGSALSATFLAANQSVGAPFPAAAGYDAAAWTGAIVVVGAVLGAMLLGRRPNGAGDVERQ